MILSYIHDDQSRSREKNTEFFKNETRKLERDYNQGKRNLVENQLRTLADKVVFSNKRQTERGSHWSFFEVWYGRMREMARMVKKWFLGFGGKAKRQKNGSWATHSRVQSPYVKLAG